MKDKTQKKDKDENYYYCANRLSGEYECSLAVITKCDEIKQEVKDFKDKALAAIPEDVK